MTYVARTDTTSSQSDTRWHATTAVLAVAGIVAAALGAWLAFGPDTGTLTLFEWTWNVSEIHELWAPLLMIGGGAVTALSMGIGSAHEWGTESHAWLIGLEFLVAAAGVAAVVIGIVLLV